MEKTTFSDHPTCLQCRFSDTIINQGGAALFICRLKPPVIAHAYMPKGPGQADLISNAIWPLIATTDWCGSLEMKTN